MHLGGIHKNFDGVGEILNHMEAIQDRWEDFIPEFNDPVPGGFYVFPDKPFRKFVNERF